MAMDKLRALLGDPLMATAAGLLDPRGTYGNFGAALNKGLLAGTQARQAAQFSAMNKMQMDAMRKKQDEEARRQAELQQLRTRLQGAGTQPYEQDLFPGEQPIQGLLNNRSRQETMQEQMGLLSDYAMQNDPIGYLQSMTKGQEPTSAVQNYQYLRSIGTPHQVALDRAFSGGVNVNVGQGGEPPGLAPKPGEIYWDGKKWSRIPEETEAKQKTRGIISFAEEQNESLKEMENDEEFDLGSREQYIQNLMPQAMKDPKRQAYDLEANALVDRLNVYWSGANVPEAEIQRRKALIMVMPGDDKMTIKRKQDLRDRYIKEMKTARNPDEIKDTDAPSPPPGFTVQMP